MIFAILLQLTSCGYPTDVIMQDRPLQLIELNNVSLTSKVKINITHNFSSIVISGSHITLTKFISNNRSWIKQGRRQKHQDNFGFDFGTETGILEVEFIDFFISKNVKIYLHYFDEDCDLRITTNAPFYNLTTTSGLKTCFFHCVNSEGKSYFLSESEFELQTFKSNTKKTMNTKDESEKQILERSFTDGPSSITTKEVLNVNFDYFPTNEINIIDSFRQKGENSVKKLDLSKSSVFIAEQEDLYRANEDTNWNVLAFLMAAFAVNGILFASVSIYFTKSADAADSIESESSLINQNDGFVPKKEIIA